MYRALSARLPKVGIIVHVSEEREMITLKSDILRLYINNTGMMTFLRLIHICLYNILDTFTKSYTSDDGTQLIQQKPEKTELMSCYVGMACAQPTHAERCTRFNQTAEFVSKHTVDGKKFIFLDHRFVIYIINPANPIFLGRVYCSLSFLKQIQQLYSSALFK